MCIDTCFIRSSLRLTSSQLDMIWPSRLPLPFPTSKSNQSRTSLDVISANGSSEASLIVANPKSMRGCDICVGLGALHHCHCPTSAQPIKRHDLSVSLTPIPFILLNTLIPFNRSNLTQSNPIQTHQIKHHVGPIRRRLPTTSTS